MNIKSVRIHGYSPAQLMLEYELQFFHFNTEPASIPMLEDIEKSISIHQHQIFMALRDENKLLSAEAASYSHYSRGRRVRQQRIPAPGDLVVVRNHAINSQKGKKLESKWLRPRLLTRVTEHELSGYVRELHGTGQGKRYHMNDMMMYYEREPVIITAGVQLVTPICDTTPVTISSTRITAGRGGGRALMLPS